MKLYDVPRGSYFRVVEENAVIPPDALDIKQGDVLKALNLDGMYYNCENADGQRVYLAAFSDVEIVQ